MTIDSATTPMRVRYTATAAQTEFTVPFPIYDEADFEVWVNGVLMTYDVTPADNTEYSIGAFEAASTTITFGAPGLTSGDDVLLLNDIPVERTSDFASSGVFPVATLNKQLDKLTAMVREREDYAEMRTLRLSKTDLPENLLPLPTKANRASKIAAYDSDGNPTVIPETATQFSDWATAAAASAVAAALSEAAAAASQAAAAASESAASDSETAAATSETNAAGSAAAASASASAASVSADQAYANALVTNSDVASTTSNASIASAAQASAEAALAATLLAYDEFDDRYLGAKSANPSVDNDGNALIAGALYFNTTSNAMFVYTGSTWVVAYVSGADFLPLAGGTMAGYITLPGDPVNALHAATKQYVDNKNQWTNSDATTGAVERFKWTFNTTDGATPMSISFDAAGQWKSTSTLLRFVLNNVQVAAITNAGMKVAATGQFQWSQDANPGGTPDVGIARSAAGNIKVTNGSTGWGSLAAGGVKMTVSGWPTITTDYVAGIYIGTAQRSQMLGLDYATSSGHMTMRSDMQFTWTAGSVSTAGDVGLARDSAGVVKVTDGSTGIGAIMARSWRGWQSGVNYLYSDSVGQQFDSDYVLQWSSTVNATDAKDVGLARDAAGVLEVTDGSTGTGKLKIADGTAADHAVSKGQMEAALSYVGEAVKFFGHLHGELDSAFITGSETDPFYICLEAPFDFDIDSFTVLSVSGAFNVSVYINGTVVTGLSSVAVGTTKATHTATALNSVTAGDSVTFILIAGVDSTDEHFSWQLNGTRT